MSARAFRELDWYETPRYYELVFGTTTEREAEFLERAFELHASGRARRGRRALEPACGSGRLVEALARRGWAVTGFDASRAMLDYAAKRLRRARLEAKLVEARLESFALRGRFELAHCLVSTFKYLVTERDAREHLRRVAAALVPGGIYVLGFHLSEYGLDARSRERWVARRGATQVVCNIQSWPPDRRTRLERVRSRLVVRERGEELRTETNWDFRTYDEREAKRLLRSVPELEHVATYGFEHDADRPLPFDGERLDVVLVLRRR